MGVSSRHADSLDTFLSESEFKRQVNLLGYDVFSILLDMYEEGKFDSRIKDVFPQEKYWEFSKISDELLWKNSKYRSGLYDYLVRATDDSVKEVLGSEYDSIMEKKRRVMDSVGYDAIYKNFISGQTGDSLMEAEGDRFFYIKDKKFLRKSKNSELIWVFAKTVEFLYETTFE